MTKHVLCLRHLGNENFWKILHDSAILDSHLYKDTSLKGKRALILTADNHAADHSLCVQALTDLSAQFVHIPIDAGGIHDVSTIMKTIAAHPADICITYALPKATLEAMSEKVNIPVLGACSDAANLGAVLGDLTLMRSLYPALEKMRIAWLGGATALAHSLIEASMYVPYELFMALPEWGEPDRELLGLALMVGGKIFLTRELHLAADEAHFVYAGMGQDPASTSKALRAGIYIDNALMALAQPEARLLLAEKAAPLCRIADTVQQSPVLLEQAQAEYHLRALKTLIPCALNINA